MLKFLPDFELRSGRNGDGKRFDVQQEMAILEWQQLSGITCYRLSDFRQIALAWSIIRQD